MPRGADKTAPTLASPPVGDDRVHDRIVMGYPIPAQKPFIEIGKLFDDVKAGIKTEDIRPGGNYFEEMARIMVAMRQGIIKDSHDEACAAARKYRGN